MTNDDLTLPVFLDRKLTPYTPETVPHTRRRRHKPHRPEGARWAEAILRWVFLYDQAPAIGAGFRRVWVSEGRKWCKLADVTGLHKAKITMADWSVIARQEIAQ